MPTPSKAKVTPAPVAKKSKTPVKKSASAAEGQRKEPKSPKSPATVVHKAAAPAASKDYKLPQGRYYYANGKRKTSIARVRLYKGDGSIFINEQTLDQYFKVKLHREVAKFPLKLTGYEGKFTITVQLSGGGESSGADAVRHGISKALVLFDEGLKHTIKQAGLLTRDPRSKERKKFGLHRARRAPQFSKR